MPAVALTDAGNLYGAIEFYKTAKKKGIKPIMGVDFYVAVRTRKDMQGGIDNRRTRLVLLAKNHDGFKNLINLVTISNFEGFYYKPRIDRELIEKYNKDLVCIAPSFSSDISNALKNKNVEKAKECIDFYKKVYGTENFFIEITRHPEIQGHEGLMQQLIKLAKETGTQIVAAHDVYYLHQEDKAARDMLQLVNTSGDMSDRGSSGGAGTMDGGSEEEENFSFISAERAEELFHDIPEALDNTMKIADMCNIEIALGKWYFPNFIVESGLSNDDELKRIAYEGIPKRGMTATKEVVDRLEYELKVIKDKGYAQYFLVVSDLLRYAHENKILTNIRGSVAGSLTTYLTKITNVDPLAYKLPFERFLNPERPSAPDIDMDFADNRRDEVIEYARRKYGHDKVAQIGTFGTMMAKGAVRDIARAMGFPYDTADRISKLIPLGAQGFPMTIDKALAEVPELKEAYDKEPDTKRIIDMAKKIEGCARHISVHAAGVVISPDALTEHVPLQYDTKNKEDANGNPIRKIITQYDMHAVGEDGVGLLKFDFLGIKNLSILADAVERVKKIDNIDVDMENIPLDDKKTFEILARGETTGLFQLNGTGMTKFLIELKPSRIHDINAMVALYRPGPLESIPQYIERKHDESKVEYLDPRMKDILDMSYGVITYQDDVMMIAIKLAGYSWLEADKLRKAMGKKIPKEMEEQKDKLLKGFVKNGMGKKDANTLWKLIEPFAAYGFNKCLTGDARITDSKTGSISTIKEIYENNLKVNVLSLFPNHKLTPSKPVAVIENGEKQVFELTTRTGRKIKATSNHPFKTFSGWKNLEDLNVGQRIAIPRDLSIIQGQKSDKNRAATLGYLLSEGNLCHPHGVYFYSAKQEEVNDFIKYAKSFPNSKFTIDKSKSAMAVYCGQKDQKLGNSILEWIKKEELFYHKAVEKFIPKSVFGYNNDSLSILIGKMWQGDGCISIKNEQVYYATSSIKLADGVQHILLRLGIISTIHTKKFKYRGGFKMGHTINVTGRNNLIKFKDTAGKFLIGQKNKDLIKLVKNTEHLKENPARGTKDIIPAEVLQIIKMAMKDRAISAKVISDKLKISPRLFYFDKKKIGYQRGIIDKVGKELKSKELIDIANSHIYWDEIVQINIIGVEMTYDLTVPPEHNFIANDIIVHNSHAASYGRVAYQTSYMKANFPAIYMSAVLTAESGDVEKIAEIIAECKRMKIPILPPDINESFSQFTVVKNEQNRSKDTIRFGLVTIKNFGQGITSVIIEERKKNGHFKSLVDFLDRVKDKNLNKKSLEALIKSGALDSFGIDRGILLGNLETLLAHNKEKGKQAENQDSLFGLMTDTSTVPTLKLAEVPNIDPKEKLAWEKELLGLYISGHPLDKYKEIIAKRDMDIKKAKETLKDGTEVTLACIVEEVKPILTKKGDNMAFVKVADFTGELETVVFPKILVEFRSAFVPDKCLALKGKISERNGTKSLIVDKVKVLG